VSNGNWLIFVQRPIALVLLVVCSVLLALAAYTLVRKRKDWRAKLAEAETAKAEELRSSARENVGLVNARAIQAR